MDSSIVLFGHVHCCLQVFFLLKIINRLDHDEPSHLNLYCWHMSLYRSTGLNWLNRSNLSFKFGKINIYWLLCELTFDSRVLFPYAK